MQIAGADERICEQLECSSTSSRLTREQVVNRIIHINPTATEQFLAGFSHDSLEQYLDHLLATSVPRGPNSVWLRRGESPAILARESDS